MVLNGGKYAVGVVFKGGYIGATMEHGTDSETLADFINLRKRGFEVVLLKAE